MIQYNILVVDDSTTNIVLLESILGEKGYLINTAISVKEAIECIIKRTPDLIILDLLMPKVSGFELLEQLRKDEKTGKIPVIIVSAISDEENISRTLQMGASYYIKKPIDIPYLLELVEKSLNISVS